MYECCVWVFDFVFGVFLVFVDEYWFESVFKLCVDVVDFVGDDICFCVVDVLYVCVGVYFNDGGDFGSVDILLVEFELFGG